MPRTVVPRRVAPPSFWLGNDLYLAVNLSSAISSSAGERRRCSTPAKPSDQDRQRRSKLDAGDLVDDRLEEPSLALWRSLTSGQAKKWPRPKTAGATAPRWLVIIGGTGSGHLAAR
jgi:hypothetical protein